MFSNRTTLVAAAVVLWATAVTLAGDAGTPAIAQKTSNDGIYTKAQADRAKARYNKICADCHAFTVAKKKRPGDRPLGDEPFLKKWTGREIEELVTVIVTTMPNDGSAVVEDAEALDLVAYILQQNGYPAGSRPLSKQSASAVLVRPKK